MCLLPERDGCVNVKCNRETAEEIVPSGDIFVNDCVWYILCYLTSFLVRCYVVNIHYLVLQVSVVLYLICLFIYTNSSKTERHYLCTGVR